MNSFQMSRIEAMKLLQAGKHKIAIKYFTDALQFEPLHVECLIKRCICYLNDGLIEKALVDARLAVKLEPKNQKAIYQVAEVYYIKGEFEKALLLYHKGKALRPDDEKFRLGIQKSEMAIENCLGEGCIYQIQSDHPDSDVLISTDDEHIINESEKKSFKVMKELLHELSNDRFYLQKIIEEEELRINKFKEMKINDRIKVKRRNLKDCRVNCDKRRKFKQNFTSIRIHQTALHCIDYLDPRSDFWQQHQPFYSRKNHKYQTRVKPISINKEKTKWKAHNILLELVHIEMLGFQGDYWNAIEKAKNIISILHEVTGIEVQSTNIILSDLYSIIGNSYFKIKNYKEALKYHELDRVNGITNNIKDAVSRSMDYLGLIHFIQGDFQIAIKIWTHKIKLTVSNLELSWLYHEIGRSHMALDDYESTFKFAKKSLEKANEGMDENWQMNATILMANALTSLNRISEAIELYIKASELSKILQLKEIEVEINNIIQYYLTKVRYTEPNSFPKLKQGSWKDSQRKSNIRSNIEYESIEKSFQSFTSGKGEIEKKSKKPDSISDVTENIHDMDIYND